jgi:hypothetical protein
MPENDSLYQRQKNSGAIRAYSQLHSAIRQGKIPKLDPAIHKCADCGKPANEYDHRDYNKPLQVEPVCYVCNKARGPAIPFNDPPEPKGKAISMAKETLKPVMFRLRDEDKARLMRFCHRSRMSQSVVMHNALRRYLDDNETTADRVEQLLHPRKC